MSDVRYYRCDRGDTKAVHIAMSLFRYDDTASCVCGGTFRRVGDPLSRCSGTPSVAPESKQREPTK